MNPEFVGERGRTSRACGVVAAKMPAPPVDASPERVADFRSSKVAAARKSCATAPAALSLLRVLHCCARPSGLCELDHDFGVTPPLPGRVTGLPPTN